MSVTSVLLCRTKSVRRVGVRAFGRACGRAGETPRLFAKRVLPQDGQGSLCRGRRRRAKGKARRRQRVYRIDRVQEARRGRIGEQGEVCTPSRGIGRSIRMRGATSGRDKVVRTNPRGAKTSGRPRGGPRRLFRRENKHSTLLFSTALSRALSVATAMTGGVVRDSRPVVCGAHRRAGASLFPTSTRLVHPMDSINQTANNGSRGFLRYPRGNSNTANAPPDDTKRDPPLIFADADWSGRTTHTCTVPALSFLGPCYILIR